MNSIIAAITACAYTAIKKSLLFFVVLMFTALPFLKAQLPITPAVMQINPAPDNKALDDQVLRYLAKYTSPIVIRGVKNDLQPPKWNDPKGYWDSTLFAKLKQYNPNVITGFYTKLETYDPVNDTTFDQETLHGMNSLGVPMLIPDPKNKNTPMITNGGFIYGDSRNKKFRRWIIGRIDTTFHQKVTTDGWLFDRTWFDPVTRFFPPPYNKDSNLIQSYSDSNYTLMKQIRLAFPDAYIYINGISTETYARQTKFFDFADAQMVEAFGITEKNDSIFSSAVLPYIRMMDSSAFINKHFNILGSGHGSYANADVYHFYAEEKYWERYVYGCFLLGTNGKSSFHFTTGTGYPVQKSTMAGRFGILDLHTDYIYNRLGNAINHYTFKNNGLYTRKFENGIVVVAPVTYSLKKYNYNLANTFYDNEGNAYNKRITLKSGEAYILYSFRQPDLPCKFEINFDDGKKGNGIGLRDLPNAHIKRGSNRYISFKLINTSSIYDEFEHDIMLDWVRYQKMDSSFSFRYRTNSTKAFIQLFCEVDDTLNRKYYYAILNFSVKSNPLKSFDSNYAYRTFICPVSQPSAIPNILSSINLIN